MAALLMGSNAYLCRYGQDPGTNYGGGDTNGEYVSMCRNIDTDQSGYHIRYGDNSTPAGGLFLAQL